MTQWKFLPFYPLFIFRNSSRPVEALRRTDCGTHRPGYGGVLKGSQCHKVSSPRLHPARVLHLARRSQYAGYFEVSSIVSPFLILFYHFNFSLCFLDAPEMATEPLVLEAIPVDSLPETCLVHDQMALTVAYIPRPTSRLVSPWCLLLSRPVLLSSPPTRTVWRLLPWTTPSTSLLPLRLSPRRQRPRPG